MVIIHLYRLCSFFTKIYIAHDIDNDECKSLQKFNYIEIFI